MKPDSDYFVVLPDGRTVLSRTFLLNRGRCCGNGCHECPYDYERVAEPRRTELREERSQRDAESGG